MTSEDENKILLDSRGSKLTKAYEKEDYRVKRDKKRKRGI